MPGDDLDFVSDLNGTGDTTVSVHENDSSHGADAVQVNNQRPAQTPRETATAKVVAEPTAAETGDKKPLSLRDQISSALKGEGETPPAASQDGGPTRNPDGTFAAKAPDQVQTPTDAAPVVAAPAGIDPTVFKSLPAETQATLARTMDDLSQRQQRFARLEGVEQLISPRRDAWALNGMTETQALNQLLALSDFAGRDTAGFIRYIAENNGVDLEQLVLSQEPVDPTVKALQDQIAELQGHNSRVTIQQQQAAHTQTVNGVVAFASEKDAGGNLLRPHFEELGAEVLPYISAVKAANPNMPHNQVLQDAYERACWATPSVRSKMQAAANAAADAERLRAGAEKVERARTASTSVKSGTPTGSQAAPPPGSGSLRDTIRASMAAAS